MKPPKKPSGKANIWSQQMLSVAQKTKLSISAKSAWSAQTKAGLVDGDFDSWRRAETEIACGVASFREARNSDFRSILAHFLRLAGKTTEAAATWSKTGRAPGSDETGDTQENREAARFLIRKMVSESGGKLRPDYVMAIIAKKHPAKSEAELSSRDLQNLLFTLRARLRKK